MTSRLILDVLVFRGEDEIFSDHPAVLPTVYADGSVEIAVEVPGRTVYVRFGIADIVALALTAHRSDPP